MYDIIIVGGGPAGLTAAVYACRANKTVLVIEKETAGGQITNSPVVENIPGFTAISGNDFADLLVSQALEQGAEMEFGEVTAIRSLDEYKEVETDLGDVYKARAVILATGAKYRHLGLEREEEFIGNGISFCAVCDGAFYKDQTVAMVGGGNTALVEAVMLSDLVKKLIILQDLPFLTGEKKYQETLQEKENVEIRTGVSVKELTGESGLDGVVIEDKEGNRERIDLDGLFVAIGHVPQNEAFEEIAPLDSAGYILSDESCLTKTAGVFVAGDCRTKKVRQVVTAASDGAQAALAACDYIDGK